MTTYTDTNVEDVNVRQLRDPIHDHINLSQRLCQFIDTRQFQRLRAIKQLGTSYYVWPGACHNRFEHCIGVSYLARKLATALQRKQPYLGITDRDVECVEIAGLCHDLGHGPWSHVWDSMFMPIALPGSTWTHEKGSEQMLDFLIEENNIEIAKDDLDFIKALIAGEPEKCRPTEKPFLFDIISNKRNGLDVDKFDYICRDNRMIGDQGNISLQRLIESARVIKDQICYNIKDANQMFEICATRFRLHKQIYNHKTAKAIEYMIIDGLLAADPYMSIANRVFDPRKMVHLTDDIKARIESSEEPELAPARRIFERIANRDLYRCAEWKTIAWESYKDFKDNVTRERIVEEAKNMNITPNALCGDTGMSEALQELKPEHVIVDFSPMHYGMKEKNPMEFVRFYSKRNPNEGYRAEHGDYSTLMPAVFAEVLMRVYVKDPIFYSLVQKGYRAVLIKYVNPNAEVDATSESDTVMGDEAGTPPHTVSHDSVGEPPRTPRRHSRNASMASIGATATGNKAISVNKFATVPLGYTPTGKTNKPRGRTESLVLLGVIQEADTGGIFASEMAKVDGEEANERGGGGEGLIDSVEIHGKGAKEKVDDRPKVAYGGGSESGGDAASTSKDAAVALETEAGVGEVGGTPETPTQRATRGTKRRSETKVKEIETAGGTKRPRRISSRK